jgi:hypothetical protein
MKGRFSAALYLLLVFASGALVGAFGHRLYTVGTVSADKRGRPKNPEEWRKRYINDLQSRLNLSSDQMTQLNVILDETRERFREVHERTDPERKAIHQQQVDRINAMLSEEQRSEYAKFRAEREKQRGRPPGKP